MSKRRHKRKHRKGWLSRFDWQDNMAQWAKPEFSIIFEPQAYTKITSYVGLADGEISGLGKIRKVKENTEPWADTQVIIEDVRIFKQTCSAAGTHLSGEMLSKFIVDCIKRKEDPTSWGLWWHSHNDFGASWSGIDEQAIRLLLQGKENGELFSVCINKKHMMVGRRDTTPYGHDDADVRVQPHLNLKTLGKCEREVKKLVDYERAPKYQTLDVERDWSWNEDKRYWAPPAPPKSFPTHTPRILDWKNPGQSVSDGESKLFSAVGKRLPVPKENWVPVLRTRDSLNMGLLWQEESQLWVRISDGQGFTTEEVIAGLHKTTVGGEK